MQMWFKILALAVLQGLIAIALAHSPFCLSDLRKK